ncbi:MAG TPA: family 1 glycosylhydrolase [Candidatus Saccharimonadia bacterium]|nr:family 1 glycosylhydrolase [Candidatus Saccharimonadia bacterium]
MTEQGALTNLGQSEILNGNGAGYSGTVILPRLFNKSDFYFGVADNGAQNEGSNTNTDWYSWLTPEQRIKMAAEAATKDWGQGVVLDLPAIASKPDTYDINRAPNHLNRYLEDYAMAQMLEQETLHTSIEWSRLQPERHGPYDKEAIEHYRQMLRACRAAGMEPIIDLSHFALPQWAEKLGGWESDAVVDEFVRFAESMVKEFRNEVRYWATFNEPDTYTSMVYLPEKAIPGLPVAIMPKEMSWLHYPQGWYHFLKARRNMVRSHKEAYKAIKQAVPDAQVGFTVSQVYYDSEPDLISRGVKKAMSAVTNEYFPPRMAEDADWIGMQHYVHAHVNKLNPFDNEFAQRTDEGWEIYPEGTYHRLKSLSAVAKQYDIPIIVSESGLADRDDKYRADYIRDHIKWTFRAVDEGVDCRGFNYWCLLDNFEWDRGLWAAYGLIAVDHSDNQKRVIRPSAWEYAAIIREHKEARARVSAV